MTSPTPAPIIILAAIDGSDESAAVLRTSATLAQTLNGAELHLVHVLEPVPVEGGIAIGVEEARNTARALVRGAADRARELFTGELATHVSAGVPVHEILDLAGELGADLIVVGPRRKSFIERLGLGSVSEQVARNARCAVLVARPKSYPKPAAVEPPCADCVMLQNESGDDKVWCARHDRSSRHPHAHTHYEAPPAFARGSLLLRPEE